jgi:LytS/YehU family sensor histidine kinase
MVTDLGELFRATLVDRDVEFVTLRRELDLGTQYLEIQRVRFDERFTYRIEASAQVSDALVPPLLLQPLLENAAEHGLTEREGVIEVAVTCELVEERVHIRVTNQSAHAESASRPARGFGLDNVRERLHAAFGESARITTEHTSAGVFEARLDFPARFGTQDRHEHGS